MATPAEATRLRPEIAASWRRADLAGLDPTGRFADLVPGDVDPGSPLLLEAGPVLEQLEAGLVGSGYSTVLGDRECRVVRRWFDDAHTHDSFDELNIREGATLFETTIGTNGLGTVFETRKPITIHGPEHFVECLRLFSCYGHPIRHPLTHRIEGLLNVSAVSDTASPLLPPLIARAVHDIEQGLLGGSRTSERRLLGAFQEAAGRKRAVLAVGEDIVMCNRAASDLLSESDIALLRVLAEEPVHRDDSELRLTLTSGDTARVTVSRVSGVRRGALLMVDAHATGPHLTPAALPPRAVRTRAPAPYLVSGPPGTGRTTRARELALPPVRLLRPATALLEGSAAWAHDLERAVRRSEGSVCIDGIDLLGDELLDLVIECVDRTSRPQLVFTSGPVGTLTGRAAILAGTATDREELLPLAARRAQIPDLAVAMLREVAAHDSVHLTPGVVQALSAHDWPGNLRELRAVVAHAAARRSVGGIGLSDLPQEYRATAPGVPMAALDRAERDVIVVALRTADGNKVRAARALGVSRTTLYARMRQLRITAW